MLSRLAFEAAEPVTVPAPNRADVACFVGFVGLRPGAATSDAVRAQLRSGGWLGGPWGIDDGRIDALLHLPFVVESWDTFDRVFAWDRRALASEGKARCATYLGAAVRSFFARGGRRAVIVRVGEPWPCVGGDDREGERPNRLVALAVDGGGSRPFDPTDPGTWRGLQHLYGLKEVSHVCLPDLPDVCANEPAELVVAIDPAGAAEGFVVCSDPVPPPPDDRAVRRTAAPRLTPDGFDSWTGAVDTVRTFLAHHRRDALLVASLPLPEADARAPGLGGAHAEADWVTFLTQNGVLLADRGSAGERTASSAFVQLVWPWVRTTRSADLPEGLEGPCGLLAGVLADNALARGTFRSVAGTSLPEVIEPVPMPDLHPGTEGPTASLAGRVCLIGPDPDGVALLSDVTSSPDRSWRPGGVSRLMAAVLRAARRVGEAHLFEPNGEALWRSVEDSLEDLLDGFYRAGGLTGDGGEEPYEVRCDRTTMTQSDLDAGRLRALVTVRPVAAVERITVWLELEAGGADALLGEVA